MKVVLEKNVVKLYYGNLGLVAFFIFFQIFQSSQKSVHFGVPMINFVNILCGSATANYHMIKTCPANLVKDVQVANVQISGKRREHFVIVADSYNFMNFGV